MLLRVRTNRWQQTQRDPLNTALCVAYVQHFTEKYKAGFSQILYHVGNVLSVDLNDRRGLREPHAIALFQSDSHSCVTPGQAVSVSKRAHSGLLCG